MKSSRDRFSGFQPPHKHHPLFGDSVGTWSCRAIPGCLEIRSPIVPRSHISMPSQPRPNSAIGRTLGFGQSGDVPPTPTIYPKDCFGEVFRRRNFDGIAANPFLARNMPSRRAELFTSVCELAMDDLT